MLDLLMLTLLSCAFAVAAVYVPICLDLTRTSQPPEHQSR